MRKRSDQRKSSPSDILAKFLARHGAFNGASTTSVERTFAVGNQQFGKHCQSMNLTLMAHELKLRMEVSAEIGATLIRAAQLIWVQTFGVARRSGRHNRKCHWVAGKPAKNSKAKLKLTEAECLRRRRASVAALSQRRCRSATVVEAAARRLSKPVWTESDGKLESDLDKIGSLRKHVAFDLGALLPREHPSAEAGTEHRKRVLTN